MTMEAENESAIYDLESQPKGAVLAEKEIEILQFVNEFGFCEITQIMKRFGMKKSAAYLNMQILSRLGFIVHAHTVQGRCGAFYVTHKGINLLGLDLPQIRKIPLSIYEHHLAVIDVHIRLKELHPDAVWISERRLIREQYAEGSRKNEHLPDGVLIFSDGNQYAIEVERSPKTKPRLEQILLRYGLQSTFKEVWYFCSPSIIHATKAIAEKLPYVKTFNLSEYTS